MLISKTDCRQFAKVPSANVIAQQGIHISSLKATADISSALQGVILSQHSTTVVRFNADSMGWLTKWGEQKASTWSVDDEKTRQLQRALLSFSP